MIENQIVQLALPFTEDKDVFRKDENFVQTVSALTLSRKLNALQEDMFVELRKNIQGLLYSVDLPDLVQFNQNNVVTIEFDVTNLIRENGYRKSRIFEDAVDFAGKVMDVSIKGTSGNDFIGDGHVVFQSVSFDSKTNILTFNIMPNKLKTLVFCGNSTPLITVMSARSIRELSTINGKRLYQVLCRYVNELTFDDRQPLVFKRTLLGQMMGLSKQMTEAAKIFQVLEPACNDINRLTFSKFNVMYRYGKKGTIMSAKEGGRGADEILFSIIFKNEEDSYARRAERELYLWLQKIGKDYQPKMMLDDIKASGYLEYFTKQVLAFPSRISSRKIQSENHAINCLKRDLESHGIYLKNLKGERVCDQKISA